jgi:parvulin-like peptidyl-prolyl isomerase
MNKTIRKPVSFTLVLALILTLVLGTLTACGGSDKGSKDVLATAEGVNVTAGQVDELANFLAVMNGVTLGGLEAYQQENVKNSMTIFVVENELMKGAVKGQDIITDEVKTQLDAQLEQLYGYSETMKQDLADQGVSEDTIRYYLESQYYSQAYYDKVTEETPVTDAEIKAYYDTHKTEPDFVSPASVEVSHILVSDAAISADGRKKAEEILAKIKDGEDFAALAKEFSDDTGSAENGGEIGLVTAGGGQFVEPFETAALKLKKKGDVSGIVESTFGYHILKAISAPEKEHQKTLAESTETIMSIIQSDNFTAALKKLKEDSKIKYTVETDPETGEPPVNIQAPAAEEPAAAPGEGEESE